MRRFPSPQLADPMWGVLLVYGLCHLQPAPRQDVCVCLQVTGKAGCGHVTPSPAICLSLAFQCSLIGWFATMPPNDPFSIGFYDINLYAKPVG